MTIQTIKIGAASGKRRVRVKLGEAIEAPGLTLEQEQKRGKSYRVVGYAYGYTESGPKVDRTDVYATGLTYRGAQVLAIAVLTAPPGIIKPVSYPGHYAL